eukprot:TRINITY_DN7855_c0_g1_i1.p2 TRINITY_DN7855_c0_g1~~TRINITY_DN7855_c0_g1_i1.p2  ORF type:complete len:172 (-),score=4.85 TRINITY_DN7855_c0_g1_i1:357-872(-)
MQNKAQQQQQEIKQKFMEPTKTEEELKAPVPGGVQVLVRYLKSKVQPKSKTIKVTFPITLGQVFEKVQHEGDIVIPANFEDCVVLVLDPKIGRYFKETAGYLITEPTAIEINCPRSPDSSLSLGKVLVKWQDKQARAEVSEYKGWRRRKYQWSRSCRRFNRDNGGEKEVQR